MSKKNENPYRVGSSYHNGFAFMQKSQIVTRSMVLAHVSAFIAAARATVTELTNKQLLARYGTLEAYQADEAIAKAASADTTVLLSSRAVGAVRDTADPRGNMSAHGHVYFMDKLKKVAGDEQRFRLRFRKGDGPETLPRQRVVKAVEQVEQKKTAKKKAVKAPKATKAKVAPKAKKASKKAPAKTVETAETA